MFVDDLSLAYSFYLHWLEAPLPKKRSLFRKIEEKSIQHVSKQRKGENMADLRLLQFITVCLFSLITHYFPAKR